MRRFSSSRRSGLSLVEVMAAMLILSVGATSLLALFASASSSHKRAVDRTHTALVAEQILSTVQARYTFGMELRDLTTAVRDSLSPKIDGYFWEIAVHRPFDNRVDDEQAEGGWYEDEVVVRVAIKWSVQARAREEVYSTIILPRHDSDRR